MRRSFPLLLGIDAPDRIERTTGHGDLHWANLTGIPLTVMDWERWGSTPVGFDAGLLHAYSLHVPTVAARVRTEFTMSWTARRAGLGSWRRCAVLVWVLRGLRRHLPQWETDAPDTLTVIRRRTERIADP